MWKVDIQMATTRSPGEIKIPAPLFSPRRSPPSEGKTPRLHIETPFLNVFRPSCGFTWNLLCD
jgi:hypothetical protein